MWSQYSLSSSISDQPDLNWNRSIAEFQRRFMRFLAIWGGNLSFWGTKKGLSDTSTSPMDRAHRVLSGAIIVRLGASRLTNRHRKYSNRTLGYLTFFDITFIVFVWTDSWKSIELVSEEIKTLPIKLNIHLGKIFYLLISPQTDHLDLGRGLGQKNEITHGLVFLSPAQPIRSSDIENIDKKIFL